MPFGKYKGCLVQDLSYGYTKTLLEKQGSRLKPELAKELFSHLNDLQAQIDHEEVLDSMSDDEWR